MGRKPCCSKEEGLNRGAWTANEDKILIDYIKVHGEGKWRRLPEAAGLKRCGKSCRLRWLNYLRPDIKRGNITLDEEDLIIRLHRLLGNRWSLIAGRLPGRTDNEIKNYWNTVLSKRGPHVKEFDHIHTCEDEMKFKKQRIMTWPIISGANNVSHAKAERCTEVFISPQQEAIGKDDSIAAPSINAKLVHETAVHSESSDAPFTLLSTSKEKDISASSKFRLMDFDIGEISRLSGGLASDFMQLCDFDFSDINTVIREYGDETNNCGEALLARPEGMVEKYWSGNDCVELEASDNLDSDFGFLAAFLDSNEDLS